MESGRTVAGAPPSIAVCTPGTMIYRLDELDDTAVVPY
jgi:hypothetical protein